MDLWLIFITGLTTGGLSCLAVQGGLLASAMTKQVAVPASETRNSKKTPERQNKPQPMVTSLQLPTNPWPVVYFLAAKLAAYTLLGFLLGALGSALQITPPVQAVMQIIAAIFMIGTAANMLNLHPIFRYFVIQPPKALTRLVRNQAKGQEVFTPALLGVMTILIPCGTTQAMEALAISSGSAVLGALILFSFVLGTSPTFLVLGFLATRVRGQYQKVLAVAAAFLIMFLGLVSLDGALNILGLPSPSHAVTALLQPGGFGGFDKPPAGANIVAANLVNGVQELVVVAQPTSYQPAYLSAKSGQPIRLRMQTKGNYGCTRSFVIPSEGIRKILPETGEVVIDLPPQKAGYLRFVCGMGMYGGVITIT